MNTDAEESIAQTFAGKGAREIHAGFPRNIESIEKVLNFKIGFQDLEKVLKLAKICI